jgi:hypothetical protein
MRILLIQPFTKDSHLNPLRRKTRWPAGITAAGLCRRPVGAFTELPGNLFASAIVAIHTLYGIKQALS